MSSRWPERLWLVRHGESAGNVAREKATLAGHGRIAIDLRDVDVPLSTLGEEQAEALGRWIGDLRLRGRAGGRHRRASGPRRGPGAGGVVGRLPASAGRAAALGPGRPLGFLARELPGELPALLAEFS